MNHPTKVYESTTSPDAFGYTYQEAADIMHIHVETLKDWAQEGRIDIVKLGHRTVRITPDAIKKFYKKYEVEADFMKRVNLKEQKMKE